MRIFIVSDPVRHRIGLTGETKRDIIVPMNNEQDAQRNDDADDDCYFSDNEFMIGFLREAIGAVRKDPDRSVELMGTVIGMIKDMDERNYMTLCDAGCE